jgi:hypothetical protein
VDEAFILREFELISSVGGARGTVLNSISVGECGATGADEVTVAVNVVNAAD